MIENRKKPVSNFGKEKDGMVSWVFSINKEDTIIVKYDIDNDEAHFKLIQNADTVAQCKGEEADMLIKSHLGYNRKWIFKKDDDKWLFVHPKTEMWLETKYFITCMRLNSERSRGWLRDHIQHLIEKNGLEVSDEIKKWDRIHDEGIDSRCMGWYENLEDAVDVLEHNRMDVHECSFTYAVIEKARSGPYAQAFEVQWYIWDEEREGYIECDKPSELEHVAHFCF
jgi:hypothetical protein